MNTEPGSWRGLRKPLGDGRIRDQVLTVVDLTATFVLAAECAVAAVRVDLDLFGILVLRSWARLAAECCGTYFLASIRLPRFAIEGMPHWQS